MNYFTVSLWQGEEHYALWPETPPKVTDNVPLNYIYTEKVDKCLTLKECIDGYKKHISTTSN